MLTKAQYRSQIRQYIDDPSSKWWSDAALDVAIQLVIDDLWTEILDIQSMVTSQLQTITTLTSPGYIDLRLISSGGQLNQRFYKVQMVKNATSTFTYVNARDVFPGSGDGTVVVAPSSSYTVIGDQLWLYQTSTSYAVGPVDVRYSFKPTQFTSLTDNTVVPFPDGGESAAIYTASAMAMTKGNAEDVKQMFTLADQATKRMLASIRRQYHGMLQPWTNDDGTSWGGTQ